MTFPIMFFTDAPVWYNLVGNIVFIICILTVFGVVIFSDDVEDMLNGALFIGLGISCAILISLAWGLLVILAGIILPILLLRYIRVKIQKLHYYKKYDR